MGFAGYALGSFGPRDDGSGCHQWIYLVFASPDRELIMTLQDYLSVLAVVLIVLGFLGFAIKSDFLRRIIAFNVMSTGALLLLAAFVQDVESTPMLTSVFMMLILVTMVLTILTLQIRNKLTSRFHQHDSEGKVDSENPR